MLILNPVSTWDRVALDKDDFKKLLILFLLPLLIFTVAVQMASWIYIGRYGAGEQLIKLPMDQGIHHGLIQLGLNVLLVFLSAQCVKATAKTFHRRNTYSQAFCLACHALAPFYLACMLDAIPMMSHYATFGIAISLTLSALYYGVPRVLEPDPPSAFGIYFVLVQGRPHLHGVG